MAEQTTEQAIAEIWALFKETAASSNGLQVKETDNKLRRQKGFFSSQWENLVEALGQPSILQLFQAHGHQVRRLHQRSKVQCNGKAIEFDLILEAQTEVVVVEIKSVMTLEAIHDFLMDLDGFTNFFPLYKGYQIYGAVAGLDVSEDVARYAYRRGLFVLRVSGEDMVQIHNDAKFIPRDFGIAV